MWNESSASIKVVVLLAEPLLRAGVRATLEQSPLLRVVDSPQPWGNGIDVVITDWISAPLLTQPGNGPGAASLRPQSRVLVISQQPREHSVASALRAGIHGVVLSRCTAAELLTAVQVLAQGSSYICPEIAQRLTAHYLREELTSREEEVLKLLARGQCNKTIANHLGIAVGTVKAHVRGIMTKFAASSRTEAASIAMESGIVDVSRHTSVLQDSRAVAM